MELNSILNLSLARCRAAGAWALPSLAPSASALGYHCSALRASFLLAHIIFPDLFRSALRGMPIYDNKNIQISNFPDALTRNALLSPVNFPAISLRSGKTFIAFAPEREARNNGSRARKDWASNGRLERRRCGTQTKPHRINTRARSANQG